MSTPYRPITLSLFWQGVAESFMQRDAPACPNLGEVVRLQPDRPGQPPRFARVIDRMWRIGWGIEVDITLAPIPDPNGEVKP